MGVGEEAEAKGKRVRGVDRRGMGGLVHKAPGGKQMKESVVERLRRGCDKVCGAAEKDFCRRWRRELAKHVAASG